MAASDRSFFDGDYRLIGSSNNDMSWPSGWERMSDYHRIVESVEPYVSPVIEKPKRVRVKLERPVIRPTGFDNKKAAISWDACVDWATEVYGRWSVDLDSI
jgi:hypothetical protein